MTFSTVIKDVNRAVIKAPGARIIYGFDWAAASPEGPWLVGNDVITASTWTVYDMDGEVSTDLLTDGLFATDTTTAVALIGGVKDVEYVAANDIETANGLKDTRSLSVYCRER